MSGFQSKKTPNHAGLSDHDEKEFGHYLNCKGNDSTSSVSLQSLSKGRGDNNFYRKYLDNNNVPHLHSVEQFLTLEKIRRTNYFTGVPIISTSCQYPFKMSSSVDSLKENFYLPIISYDVPKWLSFPEFCKHLHYFPIAYAC